MGLPIPNIAILRMRFVLFLVFFFFVISTVTLRYHTLELQSIYYYFAYFSIALMMLKNVLTRSDFPHFKIGFQGIYFFVLVVIGNYLVSELNLRKKLSAAVLFLIFAFLNGLYFPNYYVYELLDFAQAQSTYKNLREMRTFLPDQEAVAKNFYLLPQEYQKEDKIVILGYRNYVAEFNEMEMITPVLQEYAILSSTLENYYIQNIKDSEHSIILYDYGALVDSVYHGTRYPNLYKYLLENYEVDSIAHIDFEHSVVILEKRDTSKDIVFTDLDFSLVNTDPENSIIYFDEPIQCDLFQMNITMKFPPFASILTTPGRIQVDYLLENNYYSERVYAIGAHALGEPFIVYVPFKEKENLWQLFYTGDQVHGDENIGIDGIRFSIWRSDSKDPLYIPPDYVINSLACMDE